MLLQSEQTINKNSIIYVPPENHPGIRKVERASSDTKTAQAV